MIALLTVVALALGAPATVLQGAATTFTVTKTADTADGTCDADCSLREAITAATANAGTDTIAFAIPGGGPHTIQSASALPTITDPVIIDGYTQSGASANTNSVASGLGLNTVLKIELDGTNAGAGANGLLITAGDSRVRGLAISRFVIGGPNSGAGIHLSTNGGNVIDGNFLGTNVTGTVALGGGGVIMLGGAGNTIGGTTAEARNVISGNGNGVSISGGVGGSSGNLVQGNFIGTDVTGTVDLGNQLEGIIAFGDNNTIGGTTASARNIISGNSRRGVQLGVGSGNLVQGNFIGTDVTGMVALGNTLGGVLIFRAADNAIGGTTAGAGNLISGNGFAGVAILSKVTPPVGVEATGNRVQGNSISSNAGLGIDLGPATVCCGDGLTSNDAGDGDSGANNLQNFPVLTSTVTGGGTGVTVAGTLDSAASSAFRVEFFANAACDPSGNGEGETFLGAATATSDSGGTAVFSVGLTKAVSPGAAITNVPLIDVPFVRFYPIAIQLVVSQRSSSLSVISIMFDDLL